MPMAGNDEPVLRAGQRHVQQPAELLFGFRIRHSALKLRCRDIAVLAGRPDGHAVDDEHGGRHCFRSGRCIRQHNDRRLQALGAVHGHNADLPFRCGEVALDLDEPGFHFGDEGLQGRRLRRIKALRTRE